MGHISSCVRVTPSADRASSFYTSGAVAGKLADAAKPLCDSLDDAHSGRFCTSPAENIGITNTKAFVTAGRLTVMGGYLRPVRIAGVELPHCFDYNLASDPEASRIVLRSNIPLQLVTLEATAGVFITVSDVERIAAAGTPLSAALVSAIRAWTPVMHAIFQGFGVNLSADIAAFLHDPLTVACAMGQPFCKFAELTVELVLESGSFRTVERTPGHDAAMMMRCAIETDVPSFRKFFMNCISK